MSGASGETEFFEKPIRPLLATHCHSCHSSEAKTRFAGLSLDTKSGLLKGGSTFGAIDEYGYRAVEDVLTIHDLHATILHLMGIDHERLTFRFGGRDFRLTDVHGQVIRQILS